MRGKPADLKILANVGALGGIAAIAAERQRTATEYPLDYGRIKGYTATHDDLHDHGQLALAAALYAMPPSSRAETVYRQLDQSRPGEYRSAFWPWDGGWVSRDRLPYDARNSRGYLDIFRRKRELEKAGALIAAEWDRLDRIERQQAQQAGVTPPERPTLDITPTPVTTITLRIDFGDGTPMEDSLTWQVRRMLLGYLTRLEDARAGSHDAETFTGDQLGLLHPTPNATLTVTCNEAPDQLAQQLADLSRLRPYAEWHEDDGPVLWWALYGGSKTVQEPPFHAGTPLDSDWQPPLAAGTVDSLYWTPLIDPSPIV